MNTRVGRLLLRVSTLVLAAFMIMSGPALAGEPKNPGMARASALYEEGTQAHAAGRHGDAARAFARADELVPDASALEAALVAVLQTDEAALGMDLAGRVARAPDNAKLARLGELARDRFHASAGRIVVHCEHCTVVIDGLPTKRGVASWVAVGAHKVSIRDGDAKEEQQVMVEAGAVMTLLPLAPNSSRPTPARPGPSSTTLPKPDGKKTHEAGPSPSWFWIALAATAAVGVGAVISGVDTAAKHADFTDGPTDEKAAEGEAAELRTNILLGVSGGLVALTLAVGLWVVDWDQDDDVAVGPEGLTVRF